MEYVLNYNYEQIIAGALIGLIDTIKESNLVDTGEFSISFSDKMDFEDRCHSVVRLTRGLYEEGFEVFINGNKYYPENDQPHYPHDNHPLLGYHAGSIHPQGVNSISVIGKRETKPSEENSLENRVE